MVADSDPGDEYEESVNKARAMFEARGARGAPAERSQPAVRVCS